MNVYHVEGVGIGHVGYGRMALEVNREIGNHVELTDDARSVVFMVVPHMVKGWWKGQSTAVFTMWETTMLPAHFHRFTPLFDTLIVPCDWNRELFADVHPNIHVVPLGIDTDLWSPQRAKPSKQFRFLTGGSGWKRKGIEQVIQAFKDARLPDSELVIKCPPDIYDDPFHGATPQHFGENITFVRQALRAEEERDLHATADCFVSATRGEGFGLIPLQQLALGNLVIGPAHTGHLMFSEHFDYALSSKPEKADMLHHKDCGDWFVPDHDELVDAMRDAYRRGRPAMVERRQRHARVAHFSWANTAKMLLEAHPPSGLLTEKIWEGAGLRPVTVRANRRVDAQVGVHRIRMSAGEEGAIPTCTLEQLVGSGAVSEI